jgi:Domain of unknown function (DUF4384)
MLNGSARRQRLAIALGLFISSFQVANATQETKQPEIQTVPYGHVAAASPKSASSQSDYTDASTVPYGEILRGIKDILDKNGLTQKQNKVKILIAEINHQNTEFPSPLSEHIMERLRLDLERSPEINLVEPPRTRGIEIVEKPRTTAALSELVGADVWFTGQVWKTANGFELRLSARRRQGNQFLGIVKAVLPSSVLPAGVNETAPNLKQAQANRKIAEQIAPLANDQSDASLKIEVWVDRGKGVVYVEGDELLVFVRANREAYVHLYYTDATNQTYRIFPNSYHPEEKIPGNVVKRIPEPQDAFIFRIKAPFGIESIMALASTKPLGDLKIATLDAGPFQQVQGGLRGLAVVPSAAQKGDVVRDTFFVTTVPAVGTSDPSWD